MEWIKVEDRLPDYVQQVLVFRGEKLVCEVMEYRQKAWNVWNGDFYEQLNNDYNDITHWMQLPEPPKENENEK